MNYLLDTHILLWWLNDDERLSRQANDAICSPANIVAVSAASIWEIAIKRRLGKLKIPAGWFDELRKEKFVNVPIAWTHAAEVERLPLHHQDPFDRLLVAQAILEDMILITHDKNILKYEVSVLKQ